MDIMSISRLVNNINSTMSGAQMLNSASIKAEEAKLSMASESEKSEWNKWKMIQDTQNKIYEIQQGVAVEQAKTQDKMFNKWDEYIKS